MIKIQYKTFNDAQHLKHGCITGVYKEGILFRINGMSHSVRISSEKIIKILFINNHIVKHTF